MHVSTAPLRDAGGTIVGGDFHSVEDLDEHCTVYFADVIGLGIAAAPAALLRGRARRVPAKFAV
jgi:serine phosphatase RsbU (regulator of sigma subunit)